jgi:VWFA-related protein
MTHRSLLISAASAIALTVWAPRSSGVVSAQGKAPSVSVYVAALKGECAPDRHFTVVNGQTFVGRIMMLPNAPGRRGGTVLRRFVEDPISRRSAEDEFRKNKAFRVVDSPNQADFVFCLCAKYQEFRPARQAKQQTQRQTDGPEMARTGTQVSAVFVGSYLKTPQDPKALAESAFWKSGDLTTESPDGQTGKTEGKDKERKEKADNRSPMIGVPAGFESEVSPHELVKRFTKRWREFEAMIVAQPKPHLQQGAAGGNEVPRPKFQPGISDTIVGETAPKAEAAPVDPSALRIETTLVIVPAMAMDKDGKYLPGLAAADFEVYEDGVKQEISDFGGAETPIHVALVLDVSGSTYYKLEDIQDAAMDFVDQLRPQDRVMVVSFDKQTRVEAEFTNEREKLIRAIMRTQPGPATSVRDAIDLTMTERLDKIQGRKAIIVFTDGVDNASYLATWEDVKARVEESGVIVYPVRYNTLEDWIPFLTASAPRPNARVIGGNSDIKEEYERAAQKLKNLAVASGGRYYEVETMGGAKQAFANIAEELRRYYWLGYYPTNTARDGKYHKINVVISKPGAAVRARPGYRAPEGDKGQSR